MVGAGDGLGRQLHRSLVAAHPADPPTFLDTPGRQAQQPSVDRLGREWSLRDDDGWLRVWCDERCAADEPFEHAGPTWGPGQRSYAVSPDGTQLAWCRDEQGFGRLVVAPIDETGVADLARPERSVVASTVNSWSGATVVALRSGATTPPQLVTYDALTGERTVLVRAGAIGWDTARLVEPSLVSWSSGDGAAEVAVPGRRYDPPDGPTGRTIWWLHGGPTDHWPVSFLPRVAFWVDRGWTVVVPDFRGSTGHGRDHQQALNGGWGVLDTADVLAGVRSLHARGVSEPARTVVMGSSAGGFTALHAIAAAPESFAAAVVSYPVGDLELLNQTTHRFEAHYNRVLVGDPVVDADRYAERSPARVAERFTRPLLVLHGDADPVVGIEQSRLLVEGIRRGGGDAELVEYEGEGHGFRQRANQLDEYARVVEFLGRHVP
ncbi:MAG: prolyl oligopeptidase family serine peptidase [Ilumatobacteraceae bacterium]